MAYISFADYQTYTGTTLAVTEQTWLLDSLIPEVTDVIEEQVGFGFEAAANSDRKFNPYENASLRNRLLFDTWAASVNSLTIDGSVIDAADYILLGDGPYYGIEMIPSSGESFMNFGADPQESIVVSAKWAYAVTPPGRIIRACMIYIQAALKNRDGSKQEWASREFYNILKSYPSFRPFG
jgi:hypothetical protein